MNVRLPQHIAVIMDGNGRWAQQHGLPRSRGHLAGVDAVRTLVRECRRHGIPYVTVYAFSKENWQRPETEISFLFDLSSASSGRSCLNSWNRIYACPSSGTTATCPSR